MQTHFRERNVDAAYDQFTANIAAITIWNVREVRDCAQDPFQSVLAEVLQTLQGHDEELGCPLSLRWKSIRATSSGLKIWLKGISGSLAPCSCKCNQIQYCRDLHYDQDVYYWLISAGGCAGWGAGHQRGAVRHTVWNVQSWQHAAQKPAAWYRCRTEYCQSAAWVAWRDNLSQLWGSE